MQALAFVSKNVGVQVKVSLRVHFIMYSVNFCVCRCIFVSYYFQYWGFLYVAVLCPSNDAPISCENLSDVKSSIDVLRTMKSLDSQDVLRLKKYFIRLAVIVRILCPQAENPLRKMIRGSDQILCCACALDAKMVK